MLYPVLRVSWTEREEDREMLVSHGVSQVHVRMCRCCDQVETAAGNHVTSLLDLRMELLMVDKQRQELFTLKSC